MLEPEGVDNFKTAVRQEKSHQLEDVPEQWTVNVGGQVAQALATFPSPTYKWSSRGTNSKTYTVISFSGLCRGKRCWVRNDTAAGSSYQEYLIWNTMLCEPHHYIDFSVITTMKLSFTVCKTYRGSLKSYSDWPHLSWGPLYTRQSSFTLIRLQNFLFHL